MKKRSYLRLGWTLALAWTLQAHASPALEPSKPLILSAAEGRAWVQRCIHDHPEILWLASSQVRYTEEGKGVAQGAYSEQLFGQKFVEFDRTLMTLRCLTLVLDGSEAAYQTFTAAQAKEVRLTRESFQTLHQEGQRLLHAKWEGMSDLQMAQAMETALVLGDIGKSEQAREVFKPYGAHAPDHDDFYEEAMHILASHPTLCPSFARLPTAAKKLLTEIANLAHYGHITHLEGGVGMFHKLKESKLPSQDPTALSFDLFVHTCDVAGALGHVNPSSSLIYTELTHRALQATAQAVRILSNPLKSELDAYLAYVTLRASWLGLDPTSSSDRVLARIGAMLRLFTPEEGVILRNAMLQIDPAMRERIRAQLDGSSLAQEGRTPTYMPAVLLNLAGHPGLGTTSEERLAKAITLGLPLLTQVLEKHKELLAKGEIDSNIPLNFNRIAGIAKTSLDALKRECLIDAEGNVSVLP